jgi:D-serine deaminase-like pyridoxal phosphate-dependent protein
MEVERILAVAEPHVTPIAVVDDAVVSRNIERMQGIARRAEARLRPHAKTHKSARVARRQLEAGAVGLTVATLREAEYFANHGVTDLLLAHPPVGEPKLARLRALAERVPRLAVTTDSLEVAASLPTAVEILWEIDTGQHRVGTEPGPAAIEAVQTLVERLGPERFRGLLTHAGHSYKAPGRADRLRIAREEVGLLRAMADELRARGIDVDEISVGSTPTAALAAEVGGMTELRPGTYIYGDANQVALGSLTLDDCALAIVAIVVSTPERRRIVIDAGAKALAADAAAPGRVGHGLVLDHPDWVIERLSEEHGVVTSAERIGARVGDRVAIIPNHVCVTVNLHGDLLVAGEQETFWDRAGARGWQ